jgi:hypothetical protein
MAYTAKIISKTIDNGVPVVTVEFTNGVTVVQESVKPSNMEGFKAWVKGRLSVFDESEKLPTDYPVDTPIDVADPVVTPPAQTQAQIDEASWRERLAKLKWVHENLIATGVLTGSETQVVNLKNGLKTDFKASYIA